MGTFSSTAQQLARDFAPDWSVPTGICFSLPERDIHEYFGLQLDSLRSCRTLLRDRLEAIENLTYYSHAEFGTWLNPNEPRFKYDRAETCCRLWLVDVLINVHTQPSPHIAPPTVALD